MSDITVRRAIELAILALEEYRRKRYASKPGKEKDAEKYNELNAAIEKLTQMASQYTLFD